MSALKWLVCVLSIFLGNLELAIAEHEIQEENHCSQLYVSLGSHCEVANFIGYNGLRTAAYPFDWMLTFNDSLVSILEQDFAFFVDESYLTPHRFGVVNQYYGIDFRHEWPDFGIHWPKMDIRRLLPEVQEKYRRRIARFYELAQFEGKVFFIRAPIDTDQSLEYSPTFNQAAKRITSEDAIALRQILLNKFPNLNFRLIIINYAEDNAPDIENLDRITEFKVRLSHKFEDWESLLQQLEQSLVNSQIL